MKIQFNIVYLTEIYKKLFELNLVTETCPPRLNVSWFQSLNKFILEMLWFLIVVGAVKISISEKVFLLKLKVMIKKQRYYFVQLVWC